MVVIVELNIIPLGVGTSVGKFLVSALEEMEKMNVKHQITPMCTIFEAKNIEEAFRIVKVVHEAIFKVGVKRVITTVRVDDRRDVDRGMKEKLESLKETLKSKP
ncbi:thiamine-binding protein [Candidatus Bathyarchaeota archaeon]|nr:MAG: thiamine-binding protein [Candidatus Bathyarchaeota archaeon]